MKKIFAAVLIQLGMTTFAFATLDAQLEGLYNKAAQQGGDAIEASYEAFKVAQQKNPTDPAALFYLGASETLMAKESWLPWRKVGYAENGIARMDKALRMLEELENPGRSAKGMPRDLLFKGIAATTFTKVPAFFNAFDRGFELYGELMGDPRLSHMPVQAVSWIYCGALEAADLGEKSELKSEWQAEAKTRGALPLCQPDKDQ
ncbi:hypothetical protein [uncultured Microbulbifer sp.]|uniref:hypothetical protein n=1 Tax=uncultured Microbulbifer sp. TaxID=348147 RepID=UPI0026278E9C|nr:hypothetical protein [uncultured Microbulbifer sp.]